jgi:hypothetical protein
MNALESRKQILIAESELNRAQLADDLAALTAGVRSFTDRAKSFGSLISAAAVLVAGPMAFRQRPPASAGAKPAWWQTLLKGAGLLSTFWMAFRSAGRDSKDPKAP